MLSYVSCVAVSKQFDYIFQEEIELTVRSTFCQRDVERNFFIESGKCIQANVSNVCNVQLARALQAAAKAPVSEGRRKLMCW